MSRAPSLRAAVAAWRKVPAQVRYSERLRASWEADYCAQMATEELASPRARAVFRRDAAAYRALADLLRAAEPRK